jgi:hypothetical protein
MTYQTQGYEDKSTRQKSMEKPSWSGQGLNQAVLPEKKKKQRTLSTFLTLHVTSFITVVLFVLLHTAPLHALYMWSEILYLFLFLGWIALIDGKGISLDLLRKTVKESYEDSKWI